MLVKLCVLLLNHLYIGLAYKFGIIKQDHFFRNLLNFTELYYTCNNFKSSPAEMERSIFFLCGTGFAAKKVAAHDDFGASENLEFQKIHFQSEMGE